MKTLREMQDEFEHAKEEERRDLLISQATEFQNNLFNSDITYGEWFDYVCYFFTYTLKYNLRKFYREIGIGIIDYADTDVATA